MKNIIRNLFIVSAFLICSGSAYSSENEIFAGRLSISKSANKITYDVVDPGESVETITNKDDIIFYEAVVVALNPTKKTYEVEINCVDSNGALVFKGVTKRKFQIKEHLGEDIIARFVQQLGMSPKKGEMIEGQFKHLNSDSDYFIKLYVDRKLIGISKFHYLIVQENRH